MRPCEPGPEREAEQAFRYRRIIAGFALLIPLGACDVPTEPPILESRWVVPAEQTRFGVGELLPGDVTLSPDSTAFVVDFDPAAFSASLASLCPACLVADGLTVPKPAFLDDVTVSVGFPAKVASVAVLDGEVVVEIVNGLNFDPLNPGDGTTGSVTLTITDTADGDVLGSLVLDGATTPLPPGSTVVRSVPLAAGTVEGGLQASALVNSPLGDPVDIDAGLSLSVTATPQNVRVASVAVDVSGQEVDFEAVELGVDDIDAELSGRVVGGAFLVDVVNPFGVSADFTVTVDGPTVAPIVKSSSLSPAPESQIRLEFSGAEFRSFLGQPGVVLTGGAVVDPAAGIIVVNPGEELVLDAQLDLTLEIGG